MHHISVKKALTSSWRPWKKPWPDERLCSWIQLDTMKTTGCPRTHLLQFTPGLSHTDLAWPMWPPSRRMTACDFQDSVKKILQCLSCSHTDTCSETPAPGQEDTKPALSMQQSSSAGRMNQPGMASSSLPHQAFWKPSSQETYATTTQQGCSQTLPQREYTVYSADLTGNRVKSRTHTTIR